MKHSYNAVAIKNKNQHSFQAILNNHGLTVSPVCVDTLWMNITRLCNQSCTHCHVDASPKRNEQMNRRTIDTCLELLSRWESCRNMDITGGAPELSDSFEYLVSEARRLDKHVVVRSNITVFFDGNPQTGEKKTYLPEFFAQNQVEILASLPHYTQEVTNSIRGQDAFEKSIKGLQLLNEQGYGKADGQLILNLVNNWDGSISPSEQAELERMFRDKLMRGWGIVFNRLFTVTNMPINRYLLLLQKQGIYEEYMGKLVDAFSPPATDRLVCRSLISVGYDDRIYDCDFNQFLGLQITNPEPVSIFDADLDTLVNRKIQFGSHCFGCTAGGGSS